MADASRIEKFQQLVEADPNDELAQFSLGNALFEAERFEEAGPCFQKVLAINTRNSKAYEMLGRVQMKTGHNDLAVQTLINGYRNADRAGDIKPKDAMGELLKELGEEPPAPAKAAAAAGVAADGTFTCRRCSGNGPKLAKQPFKGELGETIYDTVCQSCWTEWVGQGTKVINELRLPMYDPKAQELYDGHMKEFLLIE